MLRRLVRLGLIMSSLCLAPSAQAQSPEVQRSDPQWRALYWNNMTLSGDPVLEETVDHLGGDWGYGSPHPNVNADHFSARWSRFVYLEEETYRFAVKSDDGIRVYVNNRLIIDEWNDHPARTFTSELALGAGQHQIVVEYYENAGVAAAGLCWEPPSGGDTHWQGEYYDNPWLNGAHKVLRADAYLDFDWGYGSPATVIPNDGFSARWGRLVHFDGGRYRFTATSDDGVRVYVDQRLIIDEWHDHPPRADVKEVDLLPGDHRIMVEYYENGGVAVASLSWAPVPRSSMWQGEYYNNAWLGGSPALERADASIDFNWGYGSPAAGIRSDGFSARWTRTVPFESGMYRFATSTDDGVRLWVANHLLIDSWKDQVATLYSAPIYLEGETPIKMEYYENAGMAAARLSWTRVGDEPSPAGVIVVDDSDPCFVRGGLSTAWRAADGGYQGTLTWTQNNNRPRFNYNWARWYPDLQPGRYEVLVYIPEYHATSGNALYWVAHRDGYTLRRVNQAANRGRWVSLGTYRFQGSQADYLSLADVTYEAYLSREIAFDATKWVPR